MLTVTRRRLMALGSTLLLGACSDVSLDAAKSFYQLAAGGSSERAYDPVKARELPYASLDVSFPNLAPALVILATVQGDSLVWSSADNAALVTRAGRLTQIAGLAGDQDLLRTELVDGDPLADPGPLDGKRSRRLVDLAYRDLYSIPIICDWSDAGQEAVDLIGLPMTLRRSVERCSSPVVNWSFENTYWRDDSGFVWRSVQHYSPIGAAVEITVLKRYGG